MATYRINLGCHFGPLLALTVLQVNGGGAALRLQVGIWGSQSRWRKDGRKLIYLLIAFADKLLHLGLKDSKDAFYKRPKEERAQCKEDYRR